VGDAEALRRELLDKRARLVGELEKIVKYMYRNKPEWLHFRVDYLESCIRNHTRCYLLLNEIAKVEFSGITWTKIDVYKKTLKLALSRFPLVEVIIEIPRTSSSKDSELHPGKMWFYLDKEVPDSIRDELYDILGELEPKIRDLIESSITWRAAQIIATIKWIDHILKSSDISRKEDMMKKLEKARRRVAA